MSRVLEHGHVFFLYRPRVGAEEVRRLEDVQRFSLLLHSEGRALFRRLIVGRKRLPDLRTHERVWAFVADVAGGPPAPDAYPAGEGRYALVDHGGHTHLAYVLELPPRPGEAQRIFGIEREASYVIAVRNPDAPAPPSAGLQPRRRPDYPDPLRARFGGRRFSPVDPPELLDHEGAEVVIIGAAADAETELGIDLDPETERIELPFEPLERGEPR